MEFDNWMELGVTIEDIPDPGWVEMYEEYNHEVPGYHGDPLKTSKHKEAAMFRIMATLRNNNQVIVCFHYKGTAERGIELARMQSPRFNFQLDKVWAEPV